MSDVRHEQLPVSGTTSSQLVRVLVVEDDPDEAVTMRDYINRYSQEKDVPVRVDWLRSAIELDSQAESANLIFMDIGLPGMSGMEAAEMLRSEGSQALIIFTTSLAQYAIRSYEVDALDFMLKPVTYENFVLRMDKAMRVLHRTMGRSVFVQTKSGVHVMPIQDIVAIDVMGHNLAYHLCTQDDPIKLRGSLSDAEKQLMGSPFVRISNSCLVNMDHVRLIDGAEVHMSTGETFIISRPRRKAALAAIADYYGGN